jgi:CRP-like cAMP-binding protein
MEELIYYLQTIAPLSPKLEKRLRSIVRQYNWKADKTILKPGQISQRIFYVRKGLIRIYHMVDNREVTDWFIKENDICISVGSFFDQTASREYHVTLEDCECWGISFKQLEKTYAMLPEFNFHGRIISNRYYVELDNRTSFLKGQDPAIKYEWLMEGNPDFTNRIKIADMASYLDVSDRTFKTIKADYLKKSSSKRPKSR